MAFLVSDLYIFSNFEIAALAKNRIIAGGGKTANIGESAPLAPMALNNCIKKYTIKHVMIPNPKCFAKENVRLSVACENSTPKIVIATRTNGKKRRDRNWIECICVG